MDLGYDPADSCIEVWMSRVTGAAPKGCSLPTATHLYIYSLVALLYIYTSSQDILQSYKILRTPLPTATGTKAHIFTSRNHYITRRSASKNLPLLSPASYFIINPAAGWSPFSISHSSSQLQAIEADQPTPPCCGAIPGPRTSVLVVS